MKSKSLLLLTTFLVWQGLTHAETRPCPSGLAASTARLIKTTCGEVEQRLARVPGASVKATVGSFFDSRFACTRQGCVVKLSCSFRALKDQASPDAWLGQALEAKGWVRTLSHDADGPDGTVYALHKPGALCIVEGRWNHRHGDSGESHTDDAYEVAVSCGAAERRAPQSEK